MLVFGGNDSCCLSNFLQTHISWKFDHISRTYNQINYRYIWFAKVTIIYHDGTSAFFNVFFEKDPHLNAIEFLWMNNNFTWIIIICLWKTSIYGFIFCFCLCIQFKKKRVGSPSDKGEYYFLRFYFSMLLYYIYNGRQILKPSEWFYFSPIID